MGFLSRLFVPCSVHHAARPGRAAERAATPKVVKRVRRGLHPVDDAVYSMQRSATAILSGSKRGAPVFPHGNCPVHHRTVAAATKCRNPWGLHPGFRRTSGHAARRLLESRRKLAASYALRPRYPRFRRPRPRNPPRPSAYLWLSSAVTTLIESTAIALRMKPIVDRCPQG
jgi:hypothetical protein